MAWREAVACAVAFSALSLDAAASPQEVIGYGHRAIALGGTGAASAEPIEAVYANPALISLARGMALQLGLEGTYFDLHAEGPGQPGKVGYSAFRANTIAALLPLPFEGVLKGRLALALGFVTPLDVVVRGRILYPETPQFLLADRTQSVAIQAGLGADVGYGVRLGVGLAAMAALEGSVVVSTDASGRIGTVVEDTLVASYAPHAGASWEFLDRRYRLGLAFRGELVGRFNVVIEAENLGTIAIPPLNISGVAQYDPWQIALELARVSGPWRMAIGATYEHWPAYPGPVEATVRCEDRPDPGVECHAPEPPDPDFDPTVSPRIGLERILLLASHELRLRAGYAFEPSPAPEQRGRRSYYDNHRSVLSAGYGVRLDPAVAPLSFDGFVQLQLLHPRSHDKAIAEGAPLAGTVETHGLLFSAGAAATARF